MKGDDVKTRICHIHKTNVQGACAECVAEMKTRKDPALMTREERSEELRALLCDPMEVPLEMQMERINAVVGRPMFSHEMAFLKELQDEILGGQ